MIQKTRALQRASDAASARSAITARRPMLILGTAAAAILGVTLTTGIVSAPSAGADTGERVTAVAQLFSAAEPITKIADTAAVTVAEAEDAVAAAESLNVAVASSGLPIVAEETSVDTDALAKDVHALGERDVMPLLLLTVLSADTEKQTQAVAAKTETLQAALTAAQEKKAADDAAAAAAAQAAEAAAALAAANTVDGAKATARDMAASQYGWGESQFSCLNSLWTKESSWNYQAHNPSGATGIPQALPGSKMASAGGDWQTNAATQIAWGLGYISSVYGSPCSAWSHSQATNWY
ncbi:MAG: phospholipase [Microbacterium sp.]|nr:phospholipase [Microbacterium sp.]